MAKKTKKTGPNAIDVNQIDLEEMRKKVVDLPGLIEYAHSIGGFAIVPTQEGAIKSKAMQAMKEQTGEHIDQIMEQMKLLAQQAKDLQDRVHLSHEIYEAEMRFEPEIGQAYHLYKNEEGKNILSLIGPKEWGHSKPIGLFMATVQMLADHTWKILDKSNDSDTFRGKFTSQKS